MPYMEAPLNDAADALSTHYVSASLHTGDPGTTGANELTGGGYTRAAVSWDPASGMAAVTNTPMVFQIAAGNEITHLGFWDSSGAWAGYGELANSQPFNNDGELTVHQMTIHAANRSD